MFLLSPLQLSTKTVFSTQDLRQFWRDVPTDQIKQYAQYHVTKGNLRRLQRGLYALPGRIPDPLELGNSVRSLLPVYERDSLKNLVNSWEAYVRPF